MKRMSRNRGKAAPMNLTSLMDVFTILVFFLLVNSASTEVLETPKHITLPASTIEEKPRETIVIFISPEEITVQGETVALIKDVAMTEGQNIEPVAATLAMIAKNVIGVNTKAVAASREVTILADRRVPFNIIKKVMSTCTGEGYERISLAVLQKAPESAEI